MAVPSVITQLSTNTASNSPLGSENVGSPGSVDDYFRSIEAIVRSESLLKSWEVRGDIPTYISASTFSVPGDQTSYYMANRRLQANGGAITYGAILSTSYNGVISTVSLILDSGALDASLSSVYLGIDPKSASVILTGDFYPQTGGDLDGPISLSNRDVRGIKMLGMFAEFDNGNSGAGPKTIDWSNGQDQKITLNAATPALVVLPAPAVGHYQLRMIQDLTGARVPAFAGVSTSRWMGSAAQPAFNTASNGETVLTFFWDGAAYTQGHQKIGVA